MSDMALQGPAAQNGLLRNHPSMAIRRGEIKISDPIPIPREGNDGLGPQTLKHPSISSLRQLRHSQTSAASNSRRQTYGTTVSYHNQQDSVSTSVSKESNPQRRRGSALKNVMRKIFGKKRRSQHDDTEGRSPELQMVKDENPTPGLGPEGATFVTVPESLRSDRSPSLTNKGTPRPSGIQSPSAGGTVGDGSIHAERQLRRRATLPSVMLSDDEAREIVGSMTHSDGPMVGKEPPSEARRILDDLRRKGNLEDKRRSRSASAIRDLAREHRMSPIQWRRRSAEIKFWRTSVLGPNVPQVASSRPQTGASTEKEIGPTDVSETEPETEAESAQYNFGNLIGSMPNDESITLEQRVITLEVKLLDLELAIAKMQGPDKARRKASSTPDQVHAHVRGQPSVSYPPAGSEGSSRSSPSAVGEARPMSTSTLRPSVQLRSPMWRAPSSSSLADVNGITVEQYSALITLIRREQTARRTLENQVSQLQEDIRQLQRVALGSLTSGTVYPIPSPDAQEVLRFRRAMGPSRTTTRGGERPADDYDSDTDTDTSDIYSGNDSYHRSNPDPGQRRQIAGMI